MWGGFTFWESNLEVLSQCPFPTVFIQTQRKTSKRRIRLDPDYISRFWTVVVGAIAFFFAKNRQIICSNMWRLHVKNRHLGKQPHNYGISLFLMGKLTISMATTSYSSAKKW
jgi:hypothetical protein